jgi:ferrous iron transport protein B
VVIFLPQIFILFLFLVILQDSGYLARGAVLIDRPLSKIGLNGRSFVPLLSGFACAIPAMMAARTIQNRKERLLTIMCVPLMSCSARLPVYALLLAFLLPDEPLKAGLALAGLYILGIVLAIIVASIVSRLPSFADRQHTPFILELPAYRRPVAGVVFKTTCRRSWQFLKKAGPTILVISIILWVSTHLPASGAAEGDEYVAVSNSYAAKVGKVLEPAAEPMGLDWRGGVSMIMGFAAREVFVSAMVLMYRVNDSGDEEALEEGLLSTMHEVTFEGTDKQIFTTSTCVGLLFFFAMALQCFPTVVTARNEMGGWKMAILMTVFYTGGAYIGAVILVQGLRAFGVA